MRGFILHFFPMRRKPFRYALLLCAAYIAAGMPVSYAQDAECASPIAEITNLREPRFDTPSVWDLLYAEDGMDAFADLVPIDESTFVAAGSYTKDKDDTVYHPLIVKYDERLKPVWEVREETKEQRTIHRILKTKDGFTVMGDLSDPAHGNGIYIASYDDNGKPRGKLSPIFESGGDLDGKNMIPAQDGGGYIIAAQFTDTADQESQYGLLYKVGNDGNVVWKRSFRTGESTVFNNVQATQDGDYIIAGQIVLDGNKSGGWLVRVDQSGAIAWQRTYPRGQAAALQTAMQAKDGSYIMAGKIRPFDAAGNGLSAWMMKTDSTGNMVWQRFMRGAYDYAVPDQIVYEDGRSSFLVNAGSMDSQRRSHARLITFSPQGRLQHLEDFTDGQNAAASRLVSGASAERIIVGHAQTSFGEKQEGNAASSAPPYTHDAWLFAAEPLDLFEDVCAVPPAMSPILP